MQSHPELSANYSLSPKLQATTPAPARSKWPICHAAAARQGWGWGHMAMPIWGQRGDAAGSPQTRPKAPGFASPVPSSTSCWGALWPSINQPVGSWGAQQLGTSFLICTERSSFIWILETGGPGKHSSTCVSSFGKHLTTHLLAHPQLGQSHSRHARPIFILKGTYKAPIMFQAWRSQESQD